jgi:hypothetical protein
MTKPKKEVVYNPMPTLKGAITCEHGHKYSVREMNPEKKNDSCPVCGVMTNIQKGFESVRSKG